MGEIITYQLVDEKGKVILSGTYKEYFKKLSKLKIKRKRLSLLYGQRWLYLGRSYEKQHKWKKAQNELATKNRNS